MYFKISRTRKSELFTSIQIFDQFVANTNKFLNNKILRTNLLKNITITHSTVH